jgi:hypothetical protein
MDIKRYQPTSHDTSTGFRGWSTAVTVMLAILLSGNLNLIFGRAAPQWDAADFFGPEFSLVADHIKAGRLLLWDPWLAGGSPDFAEPELGTTSPVVLAFALISQNPQAGFVTYWLALWAFAGVGMLLLAKHLGSPPWGGLVASLGLIASGFFTGHAEHTSSIYTASFLPWILWRFDAALQWRNRWFGVQTAVLYGLSALGGYPELVILTAGFLILWGIGRSCWTEAQFSSSWLTNLSFMSVILGIILMVGIGITCPSYAAFFKAAQGYSDRIGPRSRVESTSSNLLPPAALSTFASPYLYLLNLPPGTWTTKPPPQARAIWPVTDVSMSSIYVGVVVTILSLVGWTKKSPWRWWLALVALGFILCSFGEFLPVRGWLYDYVPATRYFRNPSLFRIYPMVLVCIVASLEARDLHCSDDYSKDYRWLLSILLACFALITFSLVVHSSSALVPGFRIAAGHLILTWFGAVAAIFLLAKHVISKNVATRLLVAIACVDALTTFRIARPTLYAEATLPWWHLMTTDHKSSIDLGGLGLRREFDVPKLGTYSNSRNLVLKVPTLNGYITLKNRFYDRFLTDPVLRRMSLGPDRFWFSKEIVKVSPNDCSFDRFVRRVRELGKPVLVVHSREEMLSWPSKAVLETRDPRDEKGLPPAASPVTVSALFYEPNELSFRFLAPVPGWLLVTERWAPGWYATVNGRSRPVMGGDFVYRVVRVDAGDNSIRFRYKPRYFSFLLAISWSILLGAAVWQFRRVIVRTSPYTRLGTAVPQSGNRLVTNSLRVGNANSAG